MYKRLIFTQLFLFFICGSFVAAQEMSDNEPVIYTIVYNSVPPNYQYPLVGFINIANGDFNNIQLGFVNLTKGAVNGVQLGFVNSTLRAQNGIQAGYVNFVNNNLNGVQAGFINVVKKGVDGLQAGFVNTSGESVDGAQIGYVNVTGQNVDGVQVGFVNAAAKDLDGGQIGFVNTVRNLDGFQLGFVNVAESAENGIPFGFVSVVKKGGYQAFGVYADEMYPFNFSYRIGVKKLYTTFIASCNKNNQHRFSLGTGIGSILPVNNHFFFNPELINQNVIDADQTFQNITSLNLGIGTDLTNRLHLSAGPTLTWSYSANIDYLQTPYCWIYNRKINDRNNFNIGLRIGLNYTISN